MKFIKYLLSIIILGVFSVQSAHALDDSSVYSSATSQCPAQLQLTENLRSGAYNGRYHSYTGKTVSEAHLLQKHLNRLGFSSGIEDGKLGPISTSAIQRMQISLGTKPDGIVGPLTRAVLNNSCEPGDYIIPCGIDAPGCVLPKNDPNRLTEVETVEAEVISSNNVKLGMRVTFGNIKNEVGVYFIYGTDSKKVDNVSNYSHFSQVKEDKSNDTLIKDYFGSMEGYRPNYGGVHTNNYYGLLDDEKYYFRACVGNDNLWKCGKTLNFKMNDYENDIPEVKTHSIKFDSRSFNPDSPILVGSFKDDAPDRNFKVIPFFVYAYDESSIDSHSKIVSTLKKQNIPYVKNYDRNDRFEVAMHSLQGTSFYYRACVNYDVNDNGTGYATDKFTCGDIEYHETEHEFDEEEFAEKQARDAAAKAKLAQRRADIELYYIDNNTYDDVFPYITNLQLNTGNSYSLIYQSREDTYTQYTALQTRDDLFCTDGTGYAGYTNSVLFGVSCIH